MEKLKILFVSNPLWLKTGLSRNLKALLKELYPTNKYEIVHYCTQGTNQLDSKLSMYPWESVGCIKPDPKFIKSINKDPNEAKMASYGAHLFEETVKKVQPDVVWLSDDIWAFPLDRFYASWTKNINLISHITIDSIPVNKQAFEQAKKSHFFSWAKFGEDEVRKAIGDTNFQLGTIGGAVDSETYKPISQIEKSELRRKFNIDADTKVFVYVARNQLRKKFDSILRGFSKFKKQNPQEKCKLLFHTNWTEGWKLDDMIEEMGLDKGDILATYVCSKCKEFEIKPYNGEHQDCKFCGAQKSQTSASITNGVPDDNMKYIYGIADASISAFTSGGLEMQNVEAMMMGLPLATTTYSCGEEYVDCKDVFPIGHFETREIHSNFIKAEPNTNDIAKFIKKACSTPANELQSMGRRCREWAINKFDSKVIAKKWMEVFDSFEKIDYSKIHFGEPPKNPDFVPDLNIDGDEFLKHLYSGFLNVDDPDIEGLNHWRMRLQQGEPKERISSIFKEIAGQDKKKDLNFDDAFPKNGKKNLIWVVNDSPESCFLHTAFFKNYKKKYPNHNFIVVTNPSYFSFFEGNSCVDFILPHNEMFDDESFILGMGKEKSYADVYIKPQSKNIYG